MGVIVVGVNHSKGAQAALGFALDEARLRQATLRVVHAWQFGYMGATGLEGWLPQPAESSMTFARVPRPLSTKL